MQFLRKWQWANENQNTAVNNLRHLRVQWTRPQAGRCKVNIDASVLVDRNGVRFGWVVRDAMGVMKWCCVKQVQANWSPKMAEAVYLREVIGWCQNVGLDNIDIESDSKLVADSCNDPKDDISEFGMIIRCCRIEALRYHSLDIKFKRRTANEVANLLARTARNCFGFYAWKEPPYFVVPLLNFDVLHS